MRNQIVILAAGKGTRMGEIPLPKVLIMLKNKPLILYLMEELEKVNQLIEPVIVAGYMYEKVRAVLGDDYIYALQEPQLGTAHALMVAKNKIKAKNILVLYGDMPFIKAESLKSLIRSHHKSASLFSMFTSTVPDFGGEFASLNQYGRVIRNPSLNSPPKLPSQKSRIFGEPRLGGEEEGVGRIIKVTEYRDATGAERQIKEVNPGIYMFDTKWLWGNLSKINNQNAQKEYYLTDIVKIAVLQGEQIQSLQIDPKEVVGVNSKEELEIAEKILNSDPNITN